MENLYELEGTCLVVRVPEDLDHPAAERIRRDTGRILDRTYIRTMVFDFSQTEFMDSAGIGLLMGRYRALGMRKGCIRAEKVNAHIDRLLHLAGVHRYLEISSKEEEGSTAWKKTAK